jgi:hypothetical protein
MALRYGVCSLNKRDLVAESAIRLFVLSRTHKSSLRATRNICERSKQTLLEFTALVVVYTCGEDRRLLVAQVFKWRRGARGTQRLFKFSLIKVISLTVMTFN